MFHRHVNHLLTAYCQNALPEANMRRITLHLESCAHCRQEYERLLQVHNTLQHLPLYAAPETLWNRIDAQLASRKPPPALPAWTLDWRMRRTLVTAGMSAILVALVIAGKNYLSTPSWQVRRLAGAPIVGMFPMGQTGRLRVGQWLTTDTVSKAEFAVADIGNVMIAPGSRVRLMATGKNQHRLELAAGGLDAKVTAPPRLFVVDTKSARAVDLGCAYHLQVDIAGVTLLHVTTGEVELEGGKRDTLVIAGASCETRPELGQGTPVMDDAPSALKTALRRFDFEGGGAPAVEAALAAARRQDALSLWHLLPVVPESDRLRVYTVLAHLSPPPFGVTQAGVLKLDRATLDSWRDDIIVRLFASPLQFDSGLF